MIIYKGQENKIALTLTEKATRTDSDFIIEFKNEFDGESTKRVIPVIDISDYPERANIFILTESETENIQAAIVKLDPPGQWSYKAYEMLSSSPRNLNVNEAISVVETGIVEVIGQATQYGEFTQDQYKNNATFE